MSNITLQLHFFSGSDCTSSFFNHGKKSIYPKLIQQDAISKLKSVGDSLPITLLRYAIWAIFCHFLKKKPILAISFEFGHVVCMIKLIFGLK